jgi:hypothetical protein
MEEFKKFKILICLLVCIYLFSSCNNESINSDKTTAFIPEINNYDFFIEGTIDDKLVHYKQINHEWTNVSNKYFKDSKETWLQAYSDSLNYEGSWRIRVHDLNIESIQLPYTLKMSEGSITWFDSRIDLIIQDTDFCQGVDNGCTFRLTPEKGNITITEVDDRIIEGNFEGKAIIVRTGFTPGQNESLFHEIENGKFRIKYRVE